MVVVNERHNPPFPRIQCFLHQSQTDTKILVHNVGSGARKLTPAFPKEREEDGKLHEDGCFGVGSVFASPLQAKLREAALVKLASFPR